MVHPLAVAANRAQLVALVRSNLFGFAAPAIAATESAYEEMWATDLGAMAAYHGGASAAAAQLAPWQRLAGSLPGLGSPAAVTPTKTPSPPNPFRFPGIGQAIQEITSGASGIVAAGEQTLAQGEQTAAKQIQAVGGQFDEALRGDLRLLAQIRQEIEQILVPQQPAPPPPPPVV